MAVSELKENIVVVNDSVSNHLSSLSLRKSTNLLGIYQQLVTNTYPLMDGYEEVKVTNIYDLPKEDISRPGNIMKKFKELAEQEEHDLWISLSGTDVYLTSLVNFYLRNIILIDGNIDGVFLDFQDLVNQLESGLKITPDSKVMTRLFNLIALYFYNNSSNLEMIRSYVTKSRNVVSGIEKFTITTAKIHSMPFIYLRGITECDAVLQNVKTELDHVLARAANIDKRYEIYKIASYIDTKTSYFNDYGIVEIFYNSNNWLSSNRSVYLIKTIKDEFKVIF